MHFYELNKREKSNFLADETVLHLKYQTNQKTDTMNESYKKHLLVTVLHHNRFATNNQQSTRYDRSILLHWYQQKLALYLGICKSFAWKKMNENGIDSDILCSNTPGQIGVTHIIPSHHPATKSTYTLDLLL